MPIAIGALSGILLMVMTRVLTLEETYAAVNWRVIAVLAAMISLGLAMETSGGRSRSGRFLVSASGSNSPWLALALVYLATALLTEVMSNNGTAVLLGPIAISLARAMESTRCRS